MLQYPWIFINIVLWVFLCLKRVINWNQQLQFHRNWISQSDEIAPIIEVHIMKRKNYILWLSLMLVEHLWSPKSRSEHSEVVGCAFQQWCQRCGREVTFHMAMCVFQCAIQTLVNDWQTCIGNGGDYVGK